MNGWESGLVVATVGIALSALFQSVTNRVDCEARHAGPLELPVEFGLAAWVLNFYRIGLILSVAGAIGILALMEAAPSRNVALFLPAFFALLTGLGLAIDTRRMVTITEEVVVYQSPMGGFELPVSRIQWVQLGHGFIIIDVGEKTRKVIPMVFQGSGRMLATLQAMVHAAGSGDA